MDGGQGTAMSELEIVTSADRHDLDDQARAAFRQNWPEFIFHDPARPPTPW
ncbi:MAG TPA: hypothetical protein VMR00_22380 [Streptosporangiaceae bacterium]|jgi:hypothetical protein|nr:hypothetical protein [Streptosporangiaceae bacterium]